MAENVKGQNRNQQDNRIIPDGDLTNKNNNHQNASANRGGSSDIDSNALGSATGNSSRAGKGSGIAPKSGVTGSDYDGQVTER